LLSALKNPRLWQLASFGYLLVLFVGTHLPHSGPSLPIENSDKLLHFVAYAGLAILLAIAWQLSAGRLTLRHLVWLWLAVVIWAGIDEMSQPITGRIFSGADWLADAAGGLAALLLFAWIVRKTGGKGGAPGLPGDRPRQ
jgi:VanZ family protein